MAATRVSNFPDLHWVVHDKLGASGTNGHVFLAGLVATTLCHDTRVEMKIPSLGDHAILPHYHSNILFNNFISLHHVRQPRVYFSFLRVSSLGDRLGLGLCHIINLGHQNEDVGFWNNTGQTYPSGKNTSELPHP